MAHIIINSIILFQFLVVTHFAVWLVNMSVGERRMSIGQHMAGGAKLEEQLLPSD